MFEQPLKKYVKNVNCTQINADIFILDLACQTFLLDVTNLTHILQILH